MIIAIDIGTTNVKAVAFNREGEVLKTAGLANHTFMPHSGWSEQLPEMLYQNVLAVMEAVMANYELEKAVNQPISMVFSSAMHGLIAVDKDGAALTNCILWSDIRAAEIAESLLQSGGGGLEIYRRTGVPIHPMSPLLKIIWLRQNKPDVFEQTHRFLDLKSYLWYRLTGKFEIDLSCASATGLMNLQKMEWDDLALSTAGIMADKLPMLVPPRHNSAVFLQNRKEAISAIIGASDGALANLGSGATEPGHYSITIGTSAAVRCITNFPVLDEQMRTFCYRLDEKRFIVGGASNNGTNVLEWLRTSVFQSQLSPDAFANQAQLVPAGAEGLKFYPYLFGERAPIWDATAQASFVGFGPQHTQAHIIRAVMEGILLNLLTISKVLESKTPIQTIFINGGFAKNQFWVSLLAEIFQKQIVVDSSGVDASARGAFILATEV